MVLSASLGVDSPTDQPNFAAGRFLTEISKRVETLMYGLLSGQVQWPTWRRMMEQEIRQGGRGIGVIAYNFKPLDYLTAPIVAEVTDAQVNYLNAWANAVKTQANNGTLSLAQMGAMNARAQMYVKSLQEIYTRIITLQLGIPRLPFYPKQQTRCLTNCLCRWEFRQRKGVGNYDCYWVLGEAEHCPTCLARADAARPLKVRGGVIQNIEKYLLPSLHYTGK